MALRFLADHCISNYIIQTLQSTGHEVLPLRNLLPVRSRDPDVIAKAQDINAILLSLNGDFADLVRYPPKNYKGIIALQLHGHEEVLPHLMLRLLAYLGLQPEMEHYHGKLLVVEVDRIRIRQ
jgi:predicted nuclease of predicted toxin-antitoxin system